MLHKGLPAQSFNNGVCVPRFTATFQVSKISQTLELPHELAVALWKDFLRVAATDTSARLVVDNVIAKDRHQLWVTTRPGSLEFLQSLQRL